MKKILISIIIAVIAVNSFSSFVYPYIGSRRGLSIDFDLSGDFSGSTFLGLGYYIDGGIGYSSFIGVIPFSVYLGVDKNGGSIFRYDNGKLIEYVFEDDRYPVYGQFGIGTGKNMLMGLDTMFLYGKDVYLKLLPTLGFRKNDAVTIIFAGIDSTMRYYAGAGYINNWLDLRFSSSFGNQIILYLNMLTPYLGMYTDYNITTGALHADAFLSLFGLKLGGRVSITDTLDYSIISGFSFSFGATYPEGWYIKNVIKYYAKKDFEKAIELSKTGLKYYPISDKLSKYNKLARRDLLLKQVVEAYDVKDFVKARQLMSKCLKEFSNDLLVLKRAVYISEKTILNKSSYANIGLYGSQLDDFVSAMMSMYGEDYDSAVSILSDLYLKTNNEYVALKLAEVFALQGVWKNAEKMLNKVKGDFPERYFVMGMIKYLKSKAGEELFKNDIANGDIDHIKDSLFMLLKLYSQKKKFEEAKNYGAVLESLGWGKYKVEGIYYLANAYYSLGDEEKAADYFSNLVGIYEDELSDLEKREYANLYMKSLNMLVNIYEKLAAKKKNYYLSAAVYLERMIQMEKDERKKKELMEKRAVFLFKGGDYASAVFELENVVEQNKSLLKYYYSALARKEFEDVQNKISSLSYPLSMVKDDLKRVAEDYKKLLELDESFMQKEDWMNLAYISVALKDEVMYSKASEKLKDISVGEYHLLNSYMEFSMKRFSKASQELSKVNPKDLEGIFAALYYKLKGRLAYEAKNYTNAVFYLEKFMNEYKGIGMEADDLIALSKSYMEKGEADKALKVISEENVGISPVLYIIRAKALVDIKKYEEAFKTLNDLISTYDESSISKDILVQAYTMLGDVSFKIMNFPSALKYYKYAYDTFGNQEKSFLEKIRVSQLIVDVIKGTANKEEFSKYVNSKNILIKVIASVEVADRYIEKGEFQKAEGLLKELLALKYDEDSYKALVFYEYGKLYTNMGNYYDAALNYKDAWTITKDEKMLRRYLIAAIVSRNWDLINLEEIKEYESNPLVGNIVGFVKLVNGENYKDFVERKAFLRQVLFLGITGKLSYDEKYKSLFEKYLDLSDGYERAFLSAVFNYLKIPYPVKGTKIQEKEEPIKEIFRELYIGSIKEIDIPDFYVKKDYKIKWKYGVRVNKYEVIDLEKEEKVLQRSRRNYIKDKFENGFHIFYIKAYKLIEDILICDKTPMFAIKIKENEPPRFTEMSPKDMEVFVNVRFKWNTSRNLDVESNFYYIYASTMRIDVKKVEKAKTIALHLEPGDYYWFVEIKDEEGDYVFSPVEKVKASLKITPSKLCKIDLKGTSNLAASDSFVYSLNTFGKTLDVFDMKNGKLVRTFNVLASGKLYTSNKIAAIVDKGNDMLYVFDKNDGKFMFKYENPVKTNVAIDKDGKMYFAIRGRIVALDSSGSELWRYPKELFTKVDASRIIVTDKYLVALVITNGTWVILLDKQNGKAVGGFQISDKTYGNSDMILTSNGYIAVVLGNTLTISNLEGKSIKQIMLGTYSTAGIYKMVENMGNIVVADINNYYNSYVYSINTTLGTIEWKKPLDGIKDIVTGGNGEIYIVLRYSMIVLSDRGEKIGEIKELEYSYERKLVTLNKGLLILKNDTEAIVYRIPEFTYIGMWNQQGGNAQRDYYIEIKGR